jgi:hypothetical protein
LIGWGAGGVPSNVTLPLTLPVVSGSIGAAAGAAAPELAGAVLSLAPPPQEMRSIAAAHATAHDSLSDIRLIRGSPTVDYVTRRRLP